MRVVSGRTDSFNRAFRGTATAIGTGVRINLILVFTFADSFNWADILAGTTEGTVVGNNISHGKFPHVKLELTFNGNPMSPSILLY